MFRPFSRVITKVKTAILHTLGWIRGARRRPFRLAVIGLAGLLIVTGLGYVGYTYVYVPNNPTLLWSVSLKRTGKGIDGLLKGSGTSSQQATKVNGTYEFDAALIAGDGSFQIEADDTNASVRFDLGMAGIRANADVLVLKVQNSEKFDLYAKVSGLQGIGSLIDNGDKELATRIEQLNDQWISIDHSYLDQLDTKTGNKATDFSSKDVNEIIRKMQPLDDTYVFSADNQTRVFTVRQNVGKEKHNGLKTYHYKVSVDKDHLRNYLKDTKQALAATRLPTLSSDTNYNETMDKLIKSVDRLKGTETADVWVNQRTRLIQSIRIIDPQKTSDYIEFGLNYNGGSELPFYVTFIATDDGNGRVDISSVYNTKTKVNKTHVTIKLEDATNKQNAFDFTSDMTVSPSKQKPNFKTPDNAKPLKDILAEFQLPTAGAKSDMPLGSLLST